MAEYDNTDLEFKYATNWGFVGIRLFVFFAASVYTGFRIYKGNTILRFDAVRIPEDLGFYILLSILAVSLLALALILWRSYFKLRYPSIVYVNSQRIKLPESFFSTDYKSIMFRDIYNVSDRKTLLSRFLSVHHKRGKIRINKSSLEDQQSFSDLRDLIEKFHRTHHAAAVMQEIEDNRKDSPQSPARTA